MGRGFGGLLGRWAFGVLVIALLAGEAWLKRGKGVGGVAVRCCLRWIALIGRRHVVALLFAGESVVWVYFYSRVLHTRKRKH